MGRVKNLEIVKLSEIKPNSGNPKTHPEKQLKKLKNSIKKFGFLTPCLIDADNNLIAGHGRIEAAEAAGLEEVPCVRVEGLSEDEKKAYIIADNKLTEDGGWNKDLVGDILSDLDIKNFDISLTGFNIDDISSINLSDSRSFGQERTRTAKAYNMDHLEEVELSNDYWQMPVIKKEDYIPADLIGFNYAKSSENKNAGIHFFIDDYQFERIWNYPEKYIDLLKQYDCVISPEFSLYWDMPLPMKIWNTYRNRFIGSLLQENGIKVIPSICWADENTFEFCFLGVEEGSVVAVETNGVKEKQETKLRWKAGMDELIKRIKPSAILVYGGEIDYDYGETKVVYFENKVLKKWQKKK